MNEHWKIKLLKDHLNILKERNESGTITRNEIRDVELKLYYYQLGVKFASEESPIAKGENK